MAPLSLLITMLFLSLFPAQGDALTTKFFFNGTITCALGRPFQYQIHVIEKDFLTSDETISTSAFTKSDTSPTNYTITAMEDGDGPLDHYYEIKYMVYHDCAEVHMAAEMVIGKFWVHNGNHYHRYDFDITMRGIAFNW